MLAWFFLASAGILKITGVFPSITCIGMLILCENVGNSFIHTLVVYLCFYSLNRGEPKTWYGVPGYAAPIFEDAVRQEVPDLFERSPDFLHHMTTLLPPHRLVRRGVPIHTLDQLAGEFVITFPRAYHGGFNHGFNFAEAVNFCPASWVSSFFHAYFAILGIQHDICIRILCSWDSESTRAISSHHFASNPIRFSRTGLELDQLHWWTDYIIQIIELVWDLVTCVLVFDMANNSISTELS